MRKETLGSNVISITAQMERGADPAHLAIYTRFPSNYGFRVFNRRIPTLRRVIASANADLLPPLRHSSLQADGDLQSWFGRIPAAPGRAGGGGWMLTRRVQAGLKDYWVQTAMFEDPAQLWVGVVLYNLVADALIPMLLIAPALTIAMFWTTRAVLRPLSLVAREANGIGRNVAAVGGAQPLPAEGLPSEIADVVAAINRMLLRLQHAHEQQRQFTSDVAHELRTPLSVLLLEVGRLVPGPVQRQLRDEVMELGVLVNEMLRFAQAEDLLLAERLPVDVAAVTRKVCEDLAPVALRHGQEIELFGAERTCIVLGGPPLIEIAVRNVIDNAIKYGSPGSTVSVTVGAAPHVTVEDRGRGIPAQQAGRIYERFWRSDRKGVDGSGVGLALVQRVTQLHDGEVSFENRPGGGARFMLTFAPPSQIRER
ncbi:MAG TPA: HAMP domain-containing sensor histidine kinase [Acetobacteraceae bacterium]|nr:HAMP domain-containing sensor histidine kinase [Acetobacteraceae bacterium]